MNFKHLHYFWVAAKAGGIVRAGQQLHISPQTLSGQIKLLEERLGRKLFRKRGRQLELGGNLAVELLAGRHGRIPPHRPASSLDRRHEWRDARAVSACVGNEYVSHFCVVPEGRAA